MGHEKARDVIREVGKAINDNTRIVVDAMKPPEPRFICVLKAFFCGIGAIIKTMTGLKRKKSKWFLSASSAFSAIALQSALQLAVDAVQHAAVSLWGHEVSFL